MRERILGGRKSTEPVRQTCPYLGLAHDQFSHLPEPSSEHRCFLYMQRERIDRSHQERVCLTTSYPGCPWLLVHGADASDSRDTRPWQRLSSSLRERFDELERMTMRERWPRALAALGVLLGQALVTGSIEGARIVWPWIRSFALRLWIVLLIVARRVRLQVGRFLAQFGERMRAPFAGPSRAAPLDGLESVETARVEALGDQPVAPVDREVTAPAATVSARPAEPRRFAPVVAEVLTKWECVSCFTFNVPSSTFCQRCGRLSAAIEEDLLTREDFFTLDGLKALAKGDEETAHRYFVLATQANPHSELAWRWRSRTSLTLDEVIDCLEQMLLANPDSLEAQRNLEIVRARQEQEQALEAARALAQPITVRPSGPSLARRTFTVVRRLALELASIPSLILGLLWLGQPVLDALTTIGIRGLESLFPVFLLPHLVVTVPTDLLQPMIPPSIDLAVVAPIVLAIWYLLLAFRVADGSSTARYVAIVSGLVSLIAMQYVVANGRVFQIAAIALIIMSAIGQGTARRDRIGAPS